MSSILYHPNIEFKDEDYQWLIRASLFWDNIYRIVPENYTPQDNDNIKILSEDGDLIREISVKKDNWELENLRHSSSNEFYCDYCDKIETFKAKNPDWKEDSTRFNMSKADYALVEMLDELGLVVKTQSENLWQNEWIKIPKYLGDRYMSYFARHIAKENAMDLATPDSASWLAASDVLHNQSFREGEAFAFPVSINDIIPEDLNISPKNILKFRKRRKDERQHFYEQFNRFSKKLMDVSSLDVFKDIWNEECREIEKAITDYKKSMDILNVTRFVGGLSFIGLIIGNIFGYADLGLASNIMGSICLGIDVGTAITKEIIPNEINAYSYLYDVHKLAPRAFRKQPIKPKRI